MAHMTDSDRVNILLVDDQPAKLLSYEVILEELTENVYKANSARQALTLLLKHDIGVVLIDVCMPELDGFELAAMIREHPRFRRTAIIFVSAIAMTDLDRLKGYDYGAVDYVAVPVIPELLRAKVRVFAELYRKTRQLEKLNEELERRVEERTVELEKANAELEQRVEERTREREAALAQVHEIQKLDSLGQLTGGVAHDFNNLLMAVLGNLELLEKRVRGDQRSHRLVEGAIRAAERGAGLTRRLLAFARRQELHPAAVDVPGLVSGMRDLLRSSLGHTIELRTAFGRDLTRVRVDPNQLEAALLNLVLNARDAMPQGGNLTISARRENVAVDHRGELEPGEYICIAVADTGSGMDATVLARAAEPFFTTKGPDKGTGLGLSSVFGLAKQSGGTLRIASEVGAGTTVELWLPAIESAPVRDAKETPSAAPASGRPCNILLVDDDPLVTETAVCMLEDLGHHVTVASSGRQALELLGSVSPLDLVITDYAMPGMTGKELAEHIRQTRPALPIVLASGYAEIRSGDTSGLPRIDKPYGMNMLASMIRSVV